MIPGFSLRKKLSYELSSFYSSVVILVELVLFSSTSSYSTFLAFFYVVFYVMSSFSLSWFNFSDDVHSKN